MVTDSPVEAILDRLVDPIVEILPIGAAGVTLIERTATQCSITVPNTNASQFEQLPIDLGAGPCLLVVDSGQLVEVPWTISPCRRRGRDGCERLEH